ncbi:MAG: NAD-dependent epimerase/dehydratase family protein [Candidatus Bathyarchaeia archaeon]
MKALVTGGAGFIGYPVVKSLLEKGYEVKVLDKVAGDLEKVEDPRLKVIIGGLEDTDRVQQAVKGVDVVYHSAWGFAPKAKEAFRTDVEGYINVLDACVENGVKHFLFFSSSVIYGVPTYTPIDEDHPLLVEKSRAPLHALTKLAAENLSHLYYKEHNLPFTIFRFWWAFSDERVPGGTLRGIIDRILKGETIEVPKGNGGSLVYTGDVTNATHLATLNEKAFGQVFNLASFFITWEEFIDRLITLAESGSKIKVVPPEKWTGPGLLEGVWEHSIAKAERLLGYKPPEEERKKLFGRVLIRNIEARRKLQES